jgi:ubiquitin C-terminal hydrolase
MHTYTAEALDADMENANADDSMHAVPSQTLLPSTSSECLYNLVGVVVHMGQANAGHYYSFCRERRDTYSTQNGID